MTKMFLPLHNFMNFNYEYIVYIISKLQIIIQYHMNLLTNLYNPVSSLYIYIYYIILYIIKLSPHVYEIVHKHIIMF